MMEKQTEAKALTTLRSAQQAAEAAQIEHIREASRLIDLSRSIEQTIRTMEELCQVRQTQSS